MTVQDDERERELVRLFNLTWDPSHQRSGVDATFSTIIDGTNYQFDVEVKSTTGDTVSTARDVSPEHIQRWRTMMFIIGFYSKEARRPELKHCFCLTPIDMGPWIDSIEAKLGPDFKLAKLAAKRLELADLFHVCGEQETYSLSDAKRLYRNQWTAADYAAALDLTVAGDRRISQGKMLDILRLRAEYIALRGATLNNPHVTKTHLAKFIGTDRHITGPQYVAPFTAIVSEFVRHNAGHPAIRLSKS